ncbi:hypothetical protein [uncultured Tateyamaria sp.]|uniref:hypothetical protein n=1 Tax=uncultured Tateyamaria sp. TaxID=455651 RepID=UPI00261FC945|nr:hypothetical protein [uncultured Tateyamaria sp.]
MRATPILFCLVLAACAQFPELDSTVSPDVANADFPALVPLEPLLAASDPIVSDPDQTTQTLNRRVAALRARANALQRRPIVDAATRARLRQGIR